MKGRHFRLAAAAFAVFAASVPMTGPARAGIEVVGSTAPALKTGMKLPDSAVLNVPDGAAVTVLQTPGGKQFTVAGPWKGTLADYLDTQPSWWQRWKKRLFGGNSGGTPIGGTRSVRSGETPQTGATRATAPSDGGNAPQPGGNRDVK